MQIILLGHIEHVFVFFLFFIWKIMFLNSLKIMKKSPITEFNNIYEKIDNGLNSEGSWIC